MYTDPQSSILISTMLMCILPIIAILLIAAVFGMYFRLGKLVKLMERAVNGRKQNG